MNHEVKGLIRGLFTHSAEYAASRIAEAMGNPTLTTNKAIAKILPADITQIVTAGFAKSFWLRHPKCHVQSVITSALSDTLANSCRTWCWNKRVTSQPPTPSK